MRRRKLFVSSFYGIFLNKDDDDDDDDKEEAFKHFVVVVYACESDNHKIRINSSRTIVICLPILSRLTFLLPFPLFFFVPHIILL